jgi:hypothetical protein
VVIQNSFCDLSLYAGEEDPHLDGYQSAGGDDVQILHNTIRNPNEQTSAIINGTLSGDQTGVHIVGNLMAGGGYTVYCNAHQTEPVPTVEFKDNRLAMGYYTGGDFGGTSGRYGATTDCLDLDSEDRTGNVEDETGDPLTIA